MELGAPVRILSAWIFSRAQGPAESGAASIKAPIGTALAGAPLAASGRVGSGLSNREQVGVKIVVEVQDLQPNRASKYTVASYVRAVLKVHALRRELANAVLEVARCKKALAGRAQASSLMAEALALLEEFGVEADAR